MRFVRQSLVRDGSLVLSIDERMLESASQWMPSLPTTIQTEHPDGCAILVDVGATAAQPQFAQGKPDLRLGATDCWTESSTDSAYVRNDDETISATIDLSRRVARVSAIENADAHHMTSVLTLTSALLLLRDGRTPVHAGGVARPGTSEVWLLLGDSHSGKSTTTANLVKAGWSYLSDDYVVLREAAEGLEAEGWPADFHIDEGWARGESSGARSTLPEAELPAGSRIETGRMAGLIFTRIVANEPTQITGIDSSSALERLIRQTPWLMADSKSAPRLLDLLRAAASLPAGEIRLGLDSYRDAKLLAQIVTRFADQSGRVHG